MKACHITFDVAGDNVQVLDVLYEINKGEYAGRLFLVLDEPIISIVGRRADGGIIKMLERCKDQVPGVEEK